MIRNGYTLNELEPYRAKEILSPAEHSIQCFEYYSLHKVKAYDILEYLMARFEKMIDDGCHHLIKKDAKEALMYM